MTNDATRATAVALPEISRRRFLLNTTMAGAAVVVAAPVVAAEPEMTMRERAIWHMRELERLALEDGAGAVAVTVVGRPAAWHGRGSYPNLKMIMLDHRGVMHDDGGMFAPKGGAA